MAWDCFQWNEEKTAPVEEENEINGRRDPQAVVHSQFSTENGACQTVDKLCLLPLLSLRSLGLGWLSL